jgi:hypothetical protein
LALRGVGPGAEAVAEAPPGVDDEVGVPQHGEEHRNRGHQGHETVVPAVLRRRQDPAPRQLHQNDEAQDADQPHHIEIDDEEDERHDHEDRDPPAEDGVHRQAEVAEAPHTGLPALTTVHVVDMSHEDPFHQRGGGDQEVRQEVFHLSHVSSPL